MDSPCTLIETPDALAALVARLGDAPWACVDTEFVREKTYLAELCLVQVATPTELACIDAIRVPDLTPLLEWLERPGLLKILHAARQDLEIFFELRGRVPAPVFDTQVAAALLGFPDQVGFAGLVEKLCGVTLDKSQVRTDWSRRPLSDAQLAYAADDVRYLMPVFQRLRADLEERGRLDWLDEECAVLGEPGLYRTEPQDAWHRVKGQGSLGLRAHAMLEVLAAWREREARAVNRPRRWILADEALLEICNRYAQAPDPDLSGVRSLSDDAARRRKPEWTALLTPLRAAPDGPPVRPEEPDRAAIQALQARVAGVADELGVARERLATKADLVAWWRGDPGAAPRRGWRWEVFGRTLPEPEGSAR